MTRVIHYVTSAARNGANNNKLQFHIWIIHNLFQQRYLNLCVKEKVVVEKGGWMNDWQSLIFKIISTIVSLQLY